MRLYRVNAVVLRTQKLGEADRIITLFTAERGLLRAVAKGVRRTASKFGARLEPFMVADLQCYSGRSLDTITQAVTLAAYGANICGDYESFRAASVVAEAAERLGEGEHSPQQFSLVVGALRTLAQNTAPASLVRDSYLLRALALAGWNVQLEFCVNCAKPVQLAASSAAASSAAARAVASAEAVAAARAAEDCYFALQQGGVVCAACQQPGLPRMSGAVLQLMRALAAGNWQVALSSDQPTRQAAAALVAAYTQWHLERALRALKRDK